MTVRITRDGRYHYPDTIISVTSQQTDFILKVVGVGIFLLALRTLFK